MAGLQQLLSEKDKKILQLQSQLVKVSITFSQNVQKIVDGVA